MNFLFVCFSLLFRLKKEFEMRRFLQNRVIAKSLLGARLPPLASLARHARDSSTASVAAAPQAASSSISNEEVDQITTLLENDPRILMEVVNCLNPESRRRLVVAGGAMEWFGTDSAAQEVERADVDKDRQISPKDFDHWFVNALKRKMEQQKRVGEKDSALPATASGIAAVTGKGVLPPPFLTLVLVAVEAGLPFVGFGFLDNAAMILAGDAIDGTLGFYLNCSVLASAAMGNVCSGLLGMQVHGLIEKAVSRVCHFTPVLTEEQLKHPRVFLAGHIGGTLGIMIGLLLGMLPLLFLDTDPNEKSDYAIFQKWDHNKSQCIELPEFEKCLKELGLADSHEHARNLLAKYGDGKQLTFEEFSQLRSDLREGKEIF